MAEFFYISLFAYFCTVWVLDNLFVNFVLPSYTGFRLQSEPLFLAATLRRWVVVLVFL